MSLLLKLMVIPPLGAGDERLTARLPDCVGATTNPLCKLIKLPVTVRLVTAFWKPGALAVRITTPAVTPLSAKVAVVPPCAMVAVVGVTVATFGSLLARVTTAPAAGAGASSVTVAVKLRPTPSKDPGVVRVIERSETFTVALPLVKLGAEAVMFAFPAVVPAVTWNVVEVDP